MSLQVVDSDFFTTSTVQQHPLGFRYERNNGDVYRYAKVGASTISRGKIQQAPAPKTNHHNLTLAAAAAAGDTSVTFTLGATASVANEYQEGFLVLNSATDGAFQVRIKDQAAAVSSGSQTLQLFEPLPFALTVANTKGNLVHNAWNQVIEAATATTRASGVAMVGGTTGLFMWLKTKGISNVLADGTIALGALIGVSASVAGAVVVNSDTYSTAKLTTQVGQASIMAGVTAEYRPMELRID